MVKGSDNLGVISRMVYNPMDLIPHLLDFLEKSP